jgi:tetratricopeptide (TPR) repeat protein
MKFLRFAAKCAKLLFSNIEQGLSVKRLLLALLILVLAPAAAHAEYYEASSTHFRVYSEGDAQSVREFATRLERFDKAMRVMTGLQDEDLGPANRVTVYVVDGLSDVQRLARGRSDIAGFYIPRAEGSVAYTPRDTGDKGMFALSAQVVLLHEYAHHFMMQNWVGVFPPWFIEGFAEFYSTARFDRDGSVGIGLQATHRAYELMSGNLVPVEALVGNQGKQTSAQQAAIYGQGWLLTHYLTFEPKRRGQLDAYLTALKRGTPGLEAARAAFGDLRVLDRELKGYLRRPRIAYQRIDPSRLPIAPVSVRRLSPGEEAVLPFYMVSDRGVTSEEAAALIPKLRAAAAPYPNDPAVQSELAEAEYDSGHYAEAEAAADRALAVDPNDVHALTYKGMIAMARAEADQHASPAAWKEVRARLLAANRVDPNDPTPFILFYDSFKAQGIEPTRNAVTGLMRAFELAPQDRDLRIKVARQLLVDRKGPEARAALIPLAFDPHGGGLGQAMLTIMAKLDESGPEAALAAWDQATMSVQGNLIPAEPKDPPVGKEGARQAGKTG